MNKTEAIKKINKMGKAGSIICLIAKILLIIAAAGVLIGTITLFVLPKDFVTVKNTSSVETEVNLSTFIKDLSAQEYEDFQNRFAATTPGNSSINVDSQTYAVTGYNLDGNILKVNTAVETGTFTVGQIRPILVFAIIAIGCCLVSIFFAGSLCKSFAVCESPFEDAIIVKLRKLAFSLIPMAVFSFFSDGLINGILSSGKNIAFTVNFSTVFAILIILAISYIFKYGAQLQKESDETL